MARWWTCSWHITEILMKHKKGGVKLHRLFKIIYQLVFACCASLSSGTISYPSARN